MLRVEHRSGTLDVQAGQAIHTKKGEWVRYSTPEPGGAEYSRCVSRRSISKPFTGTRNN